MADFCQECAIGVLGEDTKDMAGICGEGQMVRVLCEHCGYIWVDNNGKRVGFVKDTDAEIIVGDE